MNREEVIGELLKDEKIDALTQKVDELTGLVTVLLKAIIVPQKDACGIAEITDDTIRNMALRGDVEPLQGDGSSRNYFQLKMVKGLKPRRQVKKR